MTEQKEITYLYQDLPSITPRVSRGDRISQQRPKGCADCGTQSLVNAKRSAKHLYFFYLGILVIGLVVSQLYKNKKSLPPIVLQQQKISVTPLQKITATLVNRGLRHGISILLRNNNSTEWTIREITISSQESNISTPINISIPMNNFHSTFIELPLKFSNIKQISISVKDDQDKTV